MENLSGQSIHGYDLLERIGAGGFGVIYRALQSTVGREVAIKIIKPALANKAEFIRRFEIEAQLIARLEHLHVVPLYDFWRDPQGAYLVMRWLRGGSLSDALREEPFDLESAAFLLDQVAAGLTAAHSQGIVHRDLKPSNILLDEEGNAYLADFGIAWDLRNELENKGNAGLRVGNDRRARHDSRKGERVFGSLAYLAPELFRGEDATPQSDIYSLGVTLYETVAGRHPFPSLTSVQQAFKHINEPLPRIEFPEASVFENVNEVLQRATAKNPGHRYQDALAMAAAFREAAELSRTDETADLVESLTRREQEILHLIAEGKTNRQIAQALFVEVSTVKWHITQLYKKLGVRSRVQATVRAQELNLIVSTDDIEGLPATMTGTGVYLPEPVNPYKGLKAFKPADHGDYFGREALVEELLARFVPAGSPKPGSEVGGDRFLAIVGPSGSGKSSLVQAGLIPAIWSGKLPGSEKWFIVDLVPGSRPLDELEVALMRIAADQAGNLHGLLDRDAHGLARAASLILPKDGSELVLVIDQFEELFTLTEDESARTRFMELIRAAVVDPRSKVRAIIALRADFYDRPLQYPDFGKLVQEHVQTLLPLSAEELERAIMAPAGRAGVAFETGLVATIIEEVNYRPGSLPLLQYALTELFEQRQGRLLTNEAYESIGGATGALARRAEELYQEYSDEGQESIQQMFLRLVTIGDDGHHSDGYHPDGYQSAPGLGAPVFAKRLSDTRRRVLRSELLSAATVPDRLDEIIDTYADYRLLSLDHHPATRQPTVEVAHEAILREWERLKAWLDESQTDLALHRQLIRAAAEWRESGGDWSFLLQGGKLAQFEAWAEDTRIALTAEERAFLEASLANRRERAAQEKKRQEHEARLEQRASRRLRALVAIISLALVISVGLTVAALSFARQAQTQQRLAVARELAAAALTQLDQDPELAVLLALEAADTTYLRDETIILEAENTLHRALQADRIQLTLRSYAGAVAFSPDGNLIALREPESTAGGSPVKLWDSRTGELVRELGRLLTDITDVAFSPDGQLLAASGADSLVKLWDVSSGREVTIIFGHDGSVEDVDFSPDGARLATASQDGFVRVWEIETAKPADARPVELFEPALALQPLSAPTGVAFSPDNRQVAAFVPGSSVLVWDATTGEKLLELPGTNNYIAGLGFSHDGKLLAAGTGTTGYTVWDASTGEEARSLPSPSPIIDVDFSPDSRFLAIAGEDGTAIIWDLESGRESLRLSGHTGRINRVVFSPDGDRLATGSQDDTIKIWDIRPAGSRELLTIAAHDGLVHDAVYSPDGMKIATTGEDAQIKLWDAQTGQLIKSWPGQEWVNFPAFSPDSAWLAAADEYGGVTVRSVSSGDEILSLVGDGPPPISLSFDPPGEHLAAGGPDGTYTVWDMGNGERVFNGQNYGNPIMELIYPSSDVLLAIDAGGWTIGTHVSDGRRHCGNLGQNEIIWDAEITQDGRLGAYAYWDGTARVASSDPYPCYGRGLYSLRGHAGNVTGVAFNPEGTRLATSGFDGTVRLWDMATGEQQLTLTGHALPVTGVDFSPDGRYLAAAGSDGTVRVYIMSIKELMEAARSRLSRSLTREECQRFLHLNACPEE